MSQLHRVAAAAALVCAMPFASAAVLTFNDLAGTAFFTSNYQGFQFGTNSAASNAFFYSNAATVNYVPVSGAFVSTDFQLYDNTNSYQGTTATTFMGSGPQQLITATVPFKFDGAFFSGSDTIGYRLYVGSLPVFTTSFAASTPITSGSTTFVASGFSGLVTGVEIFGRQGFYAMDNFTFNTPVPEPQTYALMVAGLLAVGGFVRRRNSTNAG